MQPLAVAPLEMKRQSNATRSDDDLNRHAENDPDTSKLVVWTRLLVVGLCIYISLLLPVECGRLFGLDLLLAIHRFVF